MSSVMKNIVLATSLSLAGLVFISCGSTGEDGGKNKPKPKYAADTLMWQDNAIVKEQKLSWDKAVSYCNTLDLQGHKDWRLPTDKELLKLFREYKAGVHKFENISSGIYWTYTDKGEYAFEVDFKAYFIPGNSPKKYENYVRCVRSK